MSRSTSGSPGPKNPTTRWFEYSAGKGVVTYYDREAKTKVDVPLPFPFAVLDTLSTVTGWHDKSGSAIYANEVHSIKDEELDVRAHKGGSLVRGLYVDLKDRIKALGGKYAASVYIAYEDAEGVVHLGNLRLTGAALRAWSDFLGTTDKYKNLLALSGTKDAKTGSVRYKVPVFSAHELPEALSAAADAKDRELQDFLKARKDSDKAAIYAKDAADDADTPF